MVGTDFASIGETGGITGSFIGSLSLVVGERVLAQLEAALGFGSTEPQMLEALLEDCDLAEPRLWFRFAQALLELGPLVRFSDAILAERAKFPAPFNEGLMRGDDVLGDHGCVAGGGVEVRWPSSAAATCSGSPPLTASVAKRRRKSCGVNRTVARRR